ncbi:MAG: 23S rRNA (pseudouridine(1915)-N(3))-methyltransferase RlmH [Deltaproteobacteria bacterium]|jgi:23S rRNA (pseudouridine1915-N3)-methyltransferase|nr:23S rRNA (pseudouridine(1915)-N(3))-methyltransferase RlmH [Deltaproteobacteria bacterium]
MNIRLIVVGKTKPPYLAEGIRDYIKRLKRYGAVEIVVVKGVPERSDRNKKLVLEKEGERILSKIDKGSFVIVLDRAGRLITSEELAGVFRRYQDRGVRSWTFVIGGALGLAPDVIRKANILLAVSKMTFTHDMTRLILVEQIYRAMTINQGTPYHK